jgi:hypothetical protein
MKAYPHMPPVHDYMGHNCTAFKKLDGSNIRCDWSKKKGWYQFALRGGGIIDPRNPVFGCVIEIFNKEYGEALADAVLQFKPFKPHAEKQGFMAFAEFYGPKSFAGLHDDNWLRHKGLMTDEEKNDPKEVTLFDLNIHKKGFVGPEDFLECTEGLKTPLVLYRGLIDNGFIKSVRDGTLPGLKPGEEGVVCKGGTGANHNDWRCKVKTTTYIDRLKLVFGVGWEKYGE